MAAGIDMNDSPITGPVADAYGFDPFAAALARGIAGMKAPAGFVIALDGPWGSGKSSVINLLRHHLEADHRNANLEVIDFNPWWYGGSEPLTRGFFATLADAVSGSLTGERQRRVREFFADAYERFYKPARALIAQAPGGSVAVAAVDAAAGVLGAERSLREEYEQLTETLRDHGRRILIVIDDIDRLDPNDAVLVFQLVKSVGRLPNVLYLLAYDGEVARRQLEHRFGPAAVGYLDKIVQATYAIPVPGPAQLRSALMKAVAPVFGGIGSTEKQARFQEVVGACIMPWLRTPRDVVRLVNLVTVGWPAIEGEADPADFLALEALKLSHPDVYRTVQQHPDFLCTGWLPDDLRGATKDKRQAVCDERLLVGMAGRDRDQMRTALGYLFPALETAYGVVWPGPGAGAAWRRDRLVCSPSHFATYFRLSPSGEALSAAEVRELLDALHDTSRLRDVLRRASKSGTSGPDPGRAGLKLLELQDRVAEIPAHAVQPLLATLFQVGDDIETPENVRNLWDIPNSLRIRKLVEELLPRHADQQARSDLLPDLARQGQPGALIAFAFRCRREHREPAGRDRKPPEERLVTAEAADRLRDIALEEIRRAAETGDLIHHARLPEILYRWNEMAEDSGQTTRQWSARYLENDANVVRFARVLTRLGGGDRTEESGFLAGLDRAPALRMSAENLARVCDVQLLDERAQMLVGRDDLAPEDKEVLERYLAARAEQRRSSEN